MPDADDMTAYMEEAFDEVEDRTGIRLDEDVHRRIYGNGPVGGRVKYRHAGIP